MHTYTHACMQACIPTYLPTYLHTYIPVYNIHTYVQTYLHTYIHIRGIHTYMPACMHIHLHTYMHTYILTCMYACIHTCVHTYIHTYVFFFAFPQPSVALQPWGRSCEAVAWHLPCCSSSWSHWEGARCQSMYTHLQAYTRPGSRSSTKKALRDVGSSRSAPNTKYTMALGAYTT